MQNLEEENKELKSQLDKFRKSEEILDKFTEELKSQFDNLSSEMLKGKDEINKRIDYNKKNIKTAFEIGCRFLLV